MIKVGITACSDPQRQEQRAENQKLLDFLGEAGYQAAVSPCIYEQEALPGSGKARAQALTAFFEDPEIREIYDISGGDLANEVLDWLDYEKIRTSQAVFWGYSDLTTVLNAIYTRTGKPGVLFSVKNLVRGEFQSLQRQRFLCREQLFSPEFQMIQGSAMEGIVVGGNIRCFLKLAGTGYFPDLRDKLLLLEARSGRVPQMIAYLSQLRSCGAFERVGGILLGTFTQMEAEGCSPDMATLVRAFAGDRIPIARTEQIGHGADAKAIWIGKNLRIS